MRQQLCYSAVFVRRQPSQHIPQVGIRVMPIELGTLNQAHDGSRTLACS